LLVKQIRAVAFSQKIATNISGNIQRTNQPLMEIGIDSFAALMADQESAATVMRPTDRLEYLLEEVATADRVGLDVFGIGEHHRADYLDSAPAVILAAAAARTKTIRWWLSLVARYVVSDHL
jgi:hypothetical protein